MATCARCHTILPVGCSNDGRVYCGATCYTIFTENLGGKGAKK